MCTQVHLTDSHRDVIACDSLARFIAYGGEGGTRNSYHTYMSMARTRTDEDGELEECIIVSVDTSKCTHDNVMYSVIYRPSHFQDRYWSVPFDKTCFVDLGAHMLSTVHMPRVLNESGQHIFHDLLGKLTTFQVGTNSYVLSMVRCNPSGTIR